MMTTFSGRDVAFEQTDDAPESERLVVLAIPGSLRRGSYNRALLEVAREVAPEGIQVDIFDLHEVPLYNGDVEAEGDPEAVRALKQRIATADALLVATPEYNGAMPGVLKNALDWASRPPERALRGKLVALIGATPGRSGATRALHSARQFFEAVGGRILSEPTIGVAQAGEHFDAEGTLVNSATRQEIGVLLAALAAEAREARQA